MPLIVVYGAVLECDKGTAPSQLVVSTASLMSVGGLPPASILDHTSGANIMPFGNCKVTGKPCAPVTPAPWSPGGSGLLLSPMSSPPLPENAKLQCTVGGEIKILNPGQNLTCCDTPDPTDCTPPERPWPPPPLTTAQKIALLAWIILGGEWPGRNPNWVGQGQGPVVPTPRPPRTGCWVAAALYGAESREFVLARFWIMEAWQGPIAWIVRRLYLRFGPALARQVERSQRLRNLLLPLFDRAVARGREELLRLNNLA